jgi:ubiquitin C-terminal hydrolase
MGPAIPNEYTFIQLKNMGSTCYINSVLQSFFSTDIVSNFCFQYQNTLSKNREKLKNAEDTTLFYFAKIYVDSQNAPQNEVYYEPTYFLDHFYSNNPIFKRYQQDDANELILYLLNDFDKSITSINKTLGKEELPLFSSFFTGSFVLKSFFEDQVVGTHKDYFSFISLDGSKMDEAIKSFENGNDMKDYNVGMVLQRTIDIFPPLLLFQTHVFAGLQKNPINIPPLFDITISGKEYALKAIIVHVGDNLDSGHYVSIYEVEKRWVFADDDKMRPLNDIEYHTFFEKGYLPGFCKATPYIMLYEIS